MKQTYAVNISASNEPIKSELHVQGLILRT